MLRRHPCPPGAPCMAFRALPARPCSLSRCWGRGCGLHTLPARYGAHSSSGLQARSQTLGEPSLPLPAPTASGPHQTPSLPVPALGHLDACQPVCPAASLTGMSTAVLRGWAACCSVGGGHLRGEGEPWAPRPPPLWNLPLSSSRRPVVRGRCGCVRIRTLWAPKSSICGLPGADWLPEGRRAWELGSLGCPQRAAVEGGCPHSQPGGGPCFVPSGGHILVGNDCLNHGGRATPPALSGPVCGVWTCVRGQRGSRRASRALGPPTLSSRTPSAQCLWAVPLFPTPCPGCPRPV